MYKSLSIRDASSPKRAFSSENNPEKISKSKVSLQIKSAIRGVFRTWSNIKMELFAKRVNG